MKVSKTHHITKDGIIKKNPSKQSSFCPNCYDKLITERREEEFDNELHTWDVIFCPSCSYTRERK